MTIGRGAVAGRLCLETGAAFEGQLYGAPLGKVHAWGEAVFNTCMTGYQEILTDPSYAGQMVVMTYPLIGNYGCRDEFAESERVHARALIVRELSASSGHDRAERTLREELALQAVPILSEVDTRALTRHLREHGSMRAVLAPSAALSLDDQLAIARGLPTIGDQDLVPPASQPEDFRAWSEPLPDELARYTRRSDTRRPTIVCLDLGIKRNQLRALASRVRGS